MKARFSESQPPVRWQPIENKVDVTICLNENIISNQDLAKYEYDFSQFRIKKDELKKEEVEANPTAFLNYSRKNSQEGRLQELEKQNEVLSKMILDILTK